MADRVPMRDWRKSRGGELRLGQRDGGPLRLGKKMRGGDQISPSALSD